jgi:hypothetical protein
MWPREARLSEVCTMARFSRFEEASGYCGTCLRQVPVGRQAINHVPHLILTLLTGVWPIFWVRDARRERPWQCLECGATVYRIMSNPFEKSKRRR